MNISYHSVIVSAVLFSGFSTVRDSEPGSKASTGEPLETCFFLLLVCADVPAASQQVGTICTIIQISLLDNGGVSCAVACGSPCNPAPDQKEPHEAPWPLLFMELLVSRVLGSAPAFPHPWLSSTNL